MPTQVTIEYADQFIPFWETADTIDVYAWATLGGTVVSGDPNVPIGPATRGVDMVTDMYNTIKTILETLTGDASVPYVPLNHFSPGIETFGIGFMPYGNPVRTRPIVAVACQASYVWGLLNIPSRLGNWDTTEFKWNFKFAAQAIGSANQSPAYNSVKAYVDDFGAPPVLMVMELDPS